MLQSGFVSAALVAAGVSLCAGASSAAVHTIDFFPEGEQANNLLMLRFLGPTGVTIESTRLVAEFTTSNGFQAENLVMLLVAPVGEGFVFVSGKDLGWVGEGTFSIDMSFDDLNGVTAPALWGFEIWSLEGDPPLYSGSFSESSRWEIIGPDVPAPASLGVLGAGGLVALRRRR